MLIKICNIVVISEKKMINKNVEKRNVLKNNDDKKNKCVHIHLKLFTFLISFVYSFKHIHLFELITTNSFICIQQHTLHLQIELISHAV